MNDKHFFADVDLPFHVWVRESRGGESRWVLRHAAEVHRAGENAGGAAAGDGAAARRPGAPV